MTILVEQPKTGVADEAKGNGGFVVPGTNSFGNTFRDYDAESERQKTVEEFYRMNHIHQTHDFVKRMREKYGKLDRVEMSIWECIELLNEFVDESDPDLDEPQIEHLLQTAEAIRKDYPNEDWLHLTGLIHDLGKVLLHPSFGELPQWAVVGDTFPVGCAFDECNVHHKHFKENPDCHNPKFNTKFGVYSEGCGLNNVLMSWGHDDYMYLVAKENKTTLPSAGLFIIRYHSFYPLHKHGAYQYLMNEEDRENLKWLHIFNKYDLYSKSKVRVDVDKVKPYYMSLIEKKLQLFCKKSTKPTEEKRREKLVHAAYLKRSLMATLQAHNLFFSSSSSSSSMSSYRKLRAGLHVPSANLRTKGVSLPKIPQMISLQRDGLSLREDNAATGCTQPRPMAPSNDEHLVSKVYAILGAIADRAEMHNIIGAQRNDWNHLLTGSINAITLTASLMAGISSIPAGEVAAPHFLAFKLSSVILFAAATGMMLITSKIQPSQLSMCMHHMDTYTLSKCFGCRHSHYE
ncbi:Leucine-rich repeat receptor-like protein kinase [Musa troglodytarum]|uniref:inositol oxygenase n=1 Tax=Musa troglodytarum TaxID=320322 RepID=A0A9E7I598_9LILI|nr:Leucine-rich repeat receptor-like protein kinase [Musa troglodytarum]